MFSKIIRTLDVVALLLSLLAVYSIIFSANLRILVIIFIVVAPLLLLLAKFKRNKGLLFSSYVCSTVFFISLIYNGFSLTGVDFFHAGVLALLISLIAILFSLLAATIGFGTCTLTIVWLTLHALVAFETFQLTGSSEFLKLFWSPITLVLAIREDYPILLMVIWVGLFLDKYQKAIMQEYLSQ